MADPVGITFMPGADAQARGPQNLADTGAGGQDLADAFKILSLRLPQTVGPRSLASQRLLTPRTGDTGGLNPHAAVFEALLRATLGGGPAPTLPTVTRGPFQVLPSARTGNPTPLPPPSPSLMVPPPVIPTTPNVTPGIGSGPTTPWAPSPSAPTPTDPGGGIDYQRSSRGGY
jgi:hypothetical protein